MQKDETFRWHPALANLKPMPETGKVETLTEAEIVAFDQRAREHFELELRMSQALREAQKPEPEEPRPGSDEAKEAIKDAIKQGAE